MDLLQFTSKGIYCERAGVFIDPWEPVDKALITHGHSDHARWGHKQYLCTDEAAPVIRHRIPDGEVQTIKFGEEIKINGVNFSFHPAGHLPGSAQIRAEYKGEVSVVSGDYKLQEDNLSEPFEPIKCDTFITESTFGLPVFKWKPQSEVIDEINAWWRKNTEKGICTVIGAYALGKAQRILKNVDASIGPILTHGAVENVNEILRGQGIELPQTERVTENTDRNKFKDALVIATPSALSSPWMKKFRPYVKGLASGWMGLRGTRRRRSVDRGFVLSDHADWRGLNEATKATGAEKIVVTHGYTDIFANWLTEQGYEAITAETQYEGELADLGEGTAEDE